MSRKVAIVTTLRGAEAVVTSFIRYHLAAGFSRIYLFFDDPADASLPIARSYGQQVTCIPNDWRLQRLWKTTRTYLGNPALRHHIASEVMARQILNADVAGGLALADGMDWLMHIDVDELFYPTGQTVPEHFEQLSDGGVTSMSYANLEGVPERTDIEDFFREITLFKQNPALLDAAQMARVNASERFGYGKKYFLYYANGKSASRVTKELSPQGVHAFNDTPARRFAKDPVVLHYPVCGFSHFWNKYRILGRFADKWFGEFDIGFSFHLQSRDLINGNDQAYARRLYEAQVVMSDPALAGDLLQAGIYCRLTQPQSIIRAAGAAWTAAQPPVQALGS
jgi:hypothetical protein